MLSWPAMVYIHRTFYAQALLDYPENPLGSPYAPSFLAANRCASVLIRAFLHTYERCPDLAGRFWGVWTHAFSSAVRFRTFLLLVYTTKALILAGYPWFNCV